MAKWARRGRRRRRGGWPVSIFAYIETAAAQTTPDPYTHDAPDAIFAALVQMEASAAPAETSLLQTIDAYRTDVLES